MGSGLQVLITLILNRCRPARLLSHRVCVFQVTVSLRPTDGSLAPCSGQVTDCSQSVGLTPAGRLSDVKSGWLCSIRCSKVTRLTPSLSQWLLRPPPRPGCHSGSRACQCMCRYVQVCAGIFIYNIGMCRYVQVCVSVSESISSFHNFDYLMQVYSWFAPGWSWVCIFSAQLIATPRWSGLQGPHPRQRAQEQRAGRAVHDSRNMEVEARAAMELQLQQHGGGGSDGVAAAPGRNRCAPSLHQLCFVRCLGNWVCTMFDQSLLVENKFTQFTLSKLLSFLVYTKFAQVYTICTDFTPILHRVYIRTGLFPGKIRPFWNLQTQYEFWANHANFE